MKKFIKFHELIVGSACSIAFLVFFAASSFGMDHPIPITLFHTNDVHSHFRPDRGPLGLGGVARLKTTLDRLRKEIPYSYLLDGGDWSEGTVYYTEGTGVEDIRMMDHLGYDVAAIGNHDWLNGPDILLDTLALAQPKTTFVAANLSSSKYKRGEEFQKWIPRYTIREQGGVKIAFIGLSTYEFVYDQFFNPIEINEPFLNTRSLASKLKKSVDVVVVISHNSLWANEKILQAAPQVDIIIGGHDHKKLPKPIEVKRLGSSPGWLVEAGAWGQYLGQMDLEVLPNKKGNDHLKLVNYQLLQMDSSVAENPETNALLDALETRIEDHFHQPIFHDHIGDSEIEFASEGLENSVANLVTDAYAHFTHADFSINSQRFIQGEIHRGPLRTVDIFNSDPRVYNPITQKTWTVKTVPLTGRALKWILYLMYGTNKLSSYGLMNSSGLSFTYDPLFLQNQMNMNSVGLNNPEISNDISNYLVEPTSIPVVKDIRIQGVPLNEHFTYRVAMGEGLIHTIRVLDSKIGNMIPLEGLKDTGVEAWRVLTDYVHTHSPLTHENVSGNRIRTLQPNLGVYSDDISWVPLSVTSVGMAATVRVRIKNWGATASPVGSSEKGPQLHLLSNQNGINYGMLEVYSDMAGKQPIPSIAPGEEKEFSWNVIVPQHQGLYPVTVRVEGVESEVNHDNHVVTKWLQNTI